MRHGFQKARDVFLRIAERLLCLQQGWRFLIFVLRQFLEFGIDRVEIVQRVLRRFQPLCVRLRVRQLRLQLAILDDAAFFKIDQQHLAGLQPPLAGNVFFRKRQHTAFGGKTNQIVRRGAEPRWAQAIAIQRRADLPTVGKAHGGRPVPRLHQCGVVFVEGAPRRVHLRVSGPGFGHQHHHRMAERKPARQQQLQRIVEAGGVGLAMRDQRPHLVEVRAQQLALHRPAARIHPVHIAANRVDLAIMRHEAIGMGQPPAGERVGTEPLVDQPQRADAIRIAQIVVKRTDLCGEQQPLVHDGAAGKAGNIGLHQRGHVVLFRKARERVQRLLADDHQLAFEGCGIRICVLASDDALAHHRHGSDDRFSQTIERGGHIAPADHALAFLGNEFFQLFGHEAPRVVVLRQEALRDGIISDGRQVVPGLRRPSADQRIGDLQQDARAIAQQRIGTHRAAMVEIGKDFQAARDDIVRFLALDMRQHTDTAGVVFVTRIVETGLGAPVQLGQIHSRTLLS